MIPLDDGKNKKDLYLLVGEIKGKLDQLSIQLNGYFENLIRQMDETNKKITRMERVLGNHQKDIDELKTRERVYRAIISFIALMVVSLLVVIIGNILKLHG